MRKKYDSECSVTAVLVIFAYKYVQEHLIIFLKTTNCYRGTE
jgi:hypothetical protein